MTINKMIEYVEKFDDNQIDQKYKDYLTQVRPMTGAGVVQLLNKCVSFIDKGFCYLEAGTHRGSTLLGAALGNKGIMCYGMDDFKGHDNPWEVAPFTCVEEGLQDAIMRLSKGNVKYFESRYQDFFRDRSDVNGTKVQVYFYDADHSEQHQYEGVKQSFPVLADEALVLVDDSGWQNKGAVWGALNRLMKEDSRLTVIKEINSKEPNDLNGMWNGIAILKFKR